MNAHLAEEDAVNAPSSIELLSRVVARIIFEQFPVQRTIPPAIARTLLLFGSSAEFPDDFKPEAMKSGWFEQVVNGLTLDEYVESVALLSALAMGHEGGVSLDWLDAPEFQEISDVFSFDAVRRVFNEHLVTTVEAFKEANQRFQGPLPPPLKKYAFNPLANTPFVEGVAPIPLAPCFQAVADKAMPPAIYHLALPKFGEGFTRDLGAVFQHYAGRQLALIRGATQVLPEVPYGTKKNSFDSCDWFLQLPGMTVLVECKARQPIESLRVGGEDWMKSVEDSIGKGIRQLNRSHDHFEQIAAKSPTLDTSKPRIGLVITLEPFYLNEMTLLWRYLPTREIPVGVVSIEELEALVLLDADELSQSLEAAATAAAGQGNVMILSSALADSAATGTSNSLLAAAWDSIGMLKRADVATRRLRKEDDET